MLGEIRKISDMCTVDVRNPVLLSDMLLRFVISFGYT